MRGYGAMRGGSLWGGGGYGSMGNQLWGSGNSWGGFARPHHRFRNYGWGGWQEPYYGGYGGYGSSNFGMSSIDSGGNFYPSSSFSYVPAAITGYTWTSGTVSAVPIKSIEPDDPKERITYKSIYKLGPDADIIEGGNIAFHLTDNAFLLAAQGKLIAVEQSSGYPTISLYPDKVLSWHLSVELDQQILGLKSAQKGKGALLNSPLVKESKEKTKALYAELSNLDKTISLLEKARNNLGQIPKTAPEPEKPPEEGATEIFASTWMLPDGKFFVVRVEDGSYVYIDSKGTYKDTKRTPLKKAYPGKFERIVFNYLKKLVKEAKSTTKDLKEDNDNTHWALEQLKAELEEEYNKNKKESTKELVDSQHKINQAIIRSEHKFAATTNQIVSMPDEVATCKKLIKTLSK